MYAAHACARFVLASLAVWRVTHLFVSEDGPGDIIVRLRARLGDSFFGKLMDCFACLSLWIAFPCTFLVSRQIVDFILIWFAISGAALLLERATSEPVIMQRTSEETRGE
jgi:Protein of unknown function (DUF1360)